MTARTMISAQDLADFLGLSVDTIWRYTREKRIPVIKVGPRQYRYVAKEVMAALSPQSQMTVKEEQAPYLARPMTHEEFSRLPVDTNYKMQLIDGYLVQEPSPTLRHQRVATRLLILLNAYVAQKDPLGQVLPAPLDLFLNKDNVVQPDLLYLPGTRPTENTPVDVLPELVVEILSPASVQNDRIKKLNLYQQVGVPHYWLVDPDFAFMECYELKGEHYAFVAGFADGNFDHPSFPGLTFAVDDIFKKP